MNGTREKIRTVKVNERGQIVIPEEMRKDLGIEPETVLVLVGHNQEIVMRREKDVLEDLGQAWRKMGQRSLERAWDKEDSVWEKHHAETKE